MSLDVEIREAGLLGEGDVEAGSGAEAAGGESQPSAGGDAGGGDADLGVAIAGDEIDIGAVSPAAKPAALAILDEEAVATFIAGWNARSGLDER